MRIANARLCNKVVNPFVWETFCGFAIGRLRIGYFEVTVIDKSAGLESTVGDCPMDNWTTTEGSKPTRSFTQPIRRKHIWL